MQFTMWMERKGIMLSAASKGEGQTQNYLSHMWDKKKQSKGVTNGQ